MDIPSHFIKPWQMFVERQGLWHGQRCHELGVISVLYKALSRYYMNEWMMCSVLMISCVYGASIRRFRTLLDGNDKIVWETYTPTVLCLCSSFSVSVKQLSKL